jgi:hypothetical protein
MKTFTQIIPEVEAGKVAMPVWHKPLGVLFRNDQGKYVLGTPCRMVTCDTLEAISQYLSALKLKDYYDSGEDNSDVVVLRDLLPLPAWHIIDTTFLEHSAPGVMLFSLRQELEEGKEVSPVVLLTTENPYSIRKSEGSLFGRFNKYLPNPMNDIIASYESVDEILVRNFHAHFPIWMVGQSPAYQAVEEEFERHQQEDYEAYIREQADFDALLSDMQIDF